MSRLTNKAVALAISVALATGAVVAASACTSSAEPRTLISVNEIASTSALTITLKNIVLEPAKTEVTYSVSTPDESKVRRLLK